MQAGAPGLLLTLRCHIKNIGIMAKFIEIPNEKNEKVLLNVDYIFEVSKDTSGHTVIKIAVSGFNNSAYYYVTTKMDYWEVRKMMDESIQI